jgi:hypothetical protein
MERNAWKSSGTSLEVYAECLQSIYNSCLGIAIDRYCCIYTPRHPTLQTHVTIFQ